MEEELVAILKDDPRYQTQLERRANAQSSYAGLGKLMVGGLFGFVLIMLLLRVPVFARWLPLLVLVAVVYGVYWFIARARETARRKRQTLEQDADGMFYSLKTGQFELDRQTGQEGMALVLADSSRVELTLRSVSRIEDLREDQHQVEQHLHLEEGKQDFTKPLLKKG
jgi:MFS superfamily sulfate permease-like transporter